MAERILTLCELNRATLARQLLLERVHLVTLEAIQQLAGLQAQLPNPPYIGLWSRVHAFEREELTQLLVQREVVRTSMMRRTLHLTTAEDYVRFRPALHSLHNRDLDAHFANQPSSCLEQDRLIAQMRAFVQEQPRTNVELRAKLAQLVPDRSEQFLYKVRISLSLIQVFPGGTWGLGGGLYGGNSVAWALVCLRSPGAALSHPQLSESLRPS